MVLSTRSYRLIKTDVIRRVALNSDKGCETRGLIVMPDCTLFSLHGLVYLILQCFGQHCCCYINYIVLMYTTIGCEGMFFNMSSTPWHLMDDCALDVRPAFTSEQTLYLTLTWMWHVSIDAVFFSSSVPVGGPSPPLKGVASPCEEGGPSFL